MREPAAALRDHIRFQRPELPPVSDVARYFAAAEAARWYSNEGPCQHELTVRLQRYLGQDLHCVPLANATLALGLGIRALVPRSSTRTEVVLPSFTFAAAAAAVVWAGLQPVFVDIDPEHWHPTADAVRAAATDRTALVLVCSTFGSPPPRIASEEWSNLGAELELPVLVDSAAGFGSETEDGFLLGAQGNAEVFSLHATKPFGIGEGGLLVSRDPEVTARVTRLANFGFADGTVTPDPGLNAKMAEWPAATALAVLDRFETILSGRRSAAHELLVAAGSMGFTAQACSGQPAWQAVPLRAPSAAVRTAVVAEAAADNIEIRTYFSNPLHRMPAFGGTINGPLITTDLLAEQVFSLPLANDQTASERERILAALERATRRAPARAN